MNGSKSKDTLIESTMQMAEGGFRDLFDFTPKEWMHMDLTAGQLRALLLFYTKGPVRMSDIAVTLGVSTATATGVMDRMVERGIVTRESDPGDRRIVLCRMSPQGERMVSGLWQAWMARSEQMLRALDRQKLLAVKGMLDALLEAGENTRDQWQV
jgi:DNA-binding MarR family transcriptional regulator